MNKELEAIISSMQEVLSGNPWYGKSVLTLLHEVDESKVYEKPAAGVHSMIELLYHMITWAEFTLKRLEKDREMEIEAFERLDWRETIVEIHSWNNGIAQFTALTNKTIELLQSATDMLLEDTVDYRTYNFRYLLHGVIQHHIYHIAQIAYVNKLVRREGL